MITRIALLCVMAGAVAIWAPAATRPPEPATPSGKSGAAKGSAKKAVPEEVATVEGVAVVRGERGFLGVQLVNGTFRIAFYDAKKKPMAPDVARAALWWDPKYKVGKERVVLTPDGDGLSLSSPRAIRPPYHFKLFITLVKEATEAGEAAGETHVIDFRV